MHILPDAYEIFCLDLVNMLVFYNNGLVLPLRGIINLEGDDILAVIIDAAIEEATHVTLH